MKLAAVKPHTLRGDLPMPDFPVDAVGLRVCAPLLGVRNMAASLAFYTDGLGFTLTEKWDEDGHIRWCWLDQRGVALMLQEYTPERRPAPSVQLGQGVSLNFVCDDALAFYRAMRDRGIAVQRPFVGNRMWVASLTDPDGYELHFESPTDAPEESQYQE